MARQEHALAKAYKEFNQCEFEDETIAARDKVVVLRAEVEAGKASQVLCLKEVGLIAVLFNVY